MDARPLSGPTVSAPQKPNASLHDLSSGVLETENTVQLNRGDLDPISQRRITTTRRSGLRSLLAIVAVLTALAATVILMARLR